MGNRVKKKLTEQSSWYKNKRKREEEDDDSNEKEHSPRKRKRAEEGSGNRSRSTEATGAATENMSAIAVIMIPYTKAKRIRNYENGGKGADRLVLEGGLTDLLHRANQWSVVRTRLPERPVPIYCLTKSRTGKNMT